MFGRSLIRRAEYSSLQSGMFVPCRFAVFTSMFDIWSIGYVLLPAVCLAFVNLMRTIRFKAVCWADCPFAIPRSMFGKLSIRCACQYVRQVVDSLCLPVRSAYGRFAVYLPAVCLAFVNSLPVYQYVRCMIDSLNIVARSMFGICQFAVIYQYVRHMVDSLSTGARSMFGTWSIC